MVIQPVILSGGFGSRLWPLSREHFPKQLLALVDDDTLLQTTTRRLSGMDTKHNITVNNPLVICNEKHRFLVAEQMMQINQPCLKIILEPEGRNTAPALSIAARAIELLGESSDPILLVMPADHVIRDIDKFHQAIVVGVQLALQDYIVTFGIIPTGPETGYGYIKKLKNNFNINTESPIFLIDKFVEKPSVEAAEEYLASGEYCWNSGIFMLRPSIWQSQIEKFSPQIAKSSKQAYDAGSDDKDFYRVDSRYFSSCPSNSIDYAVMEKICEQGSQVRGAVIPVAMGWSDIGTLSTLCKVLPQNQDNNVIKGNVITQKTKNSMVLAENRLVAALGLNNVSVVETADAVLVMNNEHAQNVKNIVMQLKQNNCQEHLSHRKVHRPWGSYESVDSGDRFQVKRLIVKPEATLSLQMHHHRAEHWIVVRGTAKVTCGEKEFLLSENQSTYIPIGEKHRLANPGKLHLEIIEVQSGSYLGEDDIVRFKDNYGRIKYTEN